jgi:hypothetical protein
VLCAALFAGGCGEWAPFAGGGGSGVGDVPCAGGAGRRRVVLLLAVEAGDVHQAVCHQSRVPSTCVPSRWVLDLAIKVGSTLAGLKVLGGSECGGKQGLEAAVKVWR